MKPALGRNLGTLLGGPVTSPAPDASEAQPQLPLAQPGPGVRSLLRGQRPDLLPETSPAPLSPSPPVVLPIPAPVRPLLPVWYFFAADVLLVALALLLIWQTPAGTGCKQRLFPIALVILGAGLALAGAWLGTNGNPDNE